MKDKVKEILFASGASAVGFAQAEVVEMACTIGFSSWLADGCHGGMKYLENHPALRRDPRGLLDDAKTVISLAFNYRPVYFRDKVLPEIATYAYGEDYHEVIRRRLSGAVKEICRLYSGDFRICVDSAPVHERYWAWKAGLGFQGLNGTFILPGKGSFFFLAEILTTLELPADEPCLETCGNCRRCIDTCPGKAIRGDKTIDARRCLSYLTIECREDWDASEYSSIPMFGCDRCQNICPHNRNSLSTDIDEFMPSEQIMSLTPAKIEVMTDDEFRRNFRHSPLYRSKLSGLRRTIEKIKLSEKK